MNIVLDFEEFKIDAKLFDTKIAKKFYDALPYSIDLTQWGGELYGSIGKDLGEDTPVSVIKEGGLAYTNRGNYFCIFYGQTPAWDVEYIGQINNDLWKKLLNRKIKKVNIRRKV